MPDQDHDLLARLNALKPSSVNLDTAPSIDIEISKPQSRESALSERLKRLRDGQDVSAPKTTSSAPRAFPSSRYTTYDDSTLGAVGEDYHDQSIDDLLAELENNKQARLYPNDPADIQHLLNEARDALPATQEEEPRDGVPQDTTESNEEQRNAEDEARDEQEADSYIQRVLAELEIEKKYSSVNDDTAVGDSDSASANATAASPPTYEDSELEARFSKLALGLPSTPRGNLVDRDKSVTSKAKSKLPTYTDEDIDSWCCICNEDGEVRCLGCDGEVYCQKCWSEGHGRGPGQEQGHKAVLYVRKGGGLAAVD